MRRVLQRHRVGGSADRDVRIGKGAVNVIGDKWGEDPPYHTPVFVLTNHARSSLAMSGGTTTFHFVTVLDVLPVVG